MLCICHYQFRKGNWGIRLFELLVWSPSSSNTSLWWPCTCFRSTVPISGKSLLCSTFRKKSTVVKPLVQGTKVTLDALLVTPGDYCWSVTTVSPELGSQPSDYDIHDFKTNVYKKYLIVLSHHIAGWCCLVLGIWNFWLSWTSSGYNTVQHLYDADIICSL